METFTERNKADWHRADIVAALRKAGWSLRRLSQKHEYHYGTLSRALRHPYFAAEQLIANAIGISPVEIWPSRYPRSGKRRSIKRERVLQSEIAING
ncbi:MAG: helix-turn-helix domain-containing protein [Nitrosomonas ureae]